MKTIYTKLFLIFILFITITSLKVIEKYEQINPNYKVHSDYVVEVHMNDKIKKIPLENYLIGVVAGEMPAEFEIEALKAQAVASRTYVMSRNLVVDNTVASQVYLNDDQMKKKWKNDYKKNKNKIKEAINETKGEVMKYKGKCISALFFSSCNGKTINCEDYFQGEKDYLKAVNSPWDLYTDPSIKRKKTFTFKQLSNIFNVNVSSIELMAYTQSGYVKNVIVSGKKYTGREIREKLGLSSSCFQIELTSKGYDFITIGSGHGVGMSQYGAQGMAKESRNYKEILNHYYQNIKIESI